MAKILVGMSGGVDSSIAAHVLKEQGHDVSGAYIRTWMNEADVFGKCPATEDIADCRTVSKFLEVDFDVVNLIDEYQAKVVDYLIEGYRSGITPNPDIMCNREIKFGIFLDYAVKNGIEYVATGHYCRKVIRKGGIAEIHEGLDKNKDQSYFLAFLEQHQADRALFPIGDMLKPEVRMLAEELQLPTAKKKDSQGICFLGKIKISDFLREYIPDEPGNIINLDGEVLGEHKGLHHFTIGQRKGIKIPSNSNFNAYVVVEKRGKTKELVVGFDKDRTQGLYANQAHISSISFVNEKLTTEETLLAKPRYRDPSQEITFIPDEGGTAMIKFKKPQRALAQGQILALYDGQRLVGGGIYSGFSLI